MGQYRCWTTPTERLLLLVVIHFLFASFLLFSFHGSPRLWHSPLTLGASTLEGYQIFLLTSPLTAAVPALQGRCLDFCVPTPFFYSLLHSLLTNDLPELWSFCLDFPDSTVHVVSSLHPKGGWFHHDFFICWAIKRYRLTDHFPCPRFFHAPFLFSSFQSWL